MLELRIEKREKTGKAAFSLKKEGKIAAVFYGRKEASTPVALKETEFLKIWKEAGESSVITLAGVGEAKEALIHEVDFDPVTGRPRHADFYIIEKGKKVQVPVQLEFTGEAPAVKSLGGTLVKVLHEIEIEAFPKDLPHSIAVDVTSLATFDSQILVKDIALPTGVVAITGAEEVVVLAAEVKEEVEEPVVAPDLDAIEISEERGKKPEEGEEATPPEPKA